MLPPPNLSIAFLQLSRAFLRAFRSVACEKHLFKHVYNSSDFPPFGSTTFLRPGFLRPFRSAACEKHLFKHLQLFGLSTFRFYHLPSTWLFETVSFCSLRETFVQTPTTLGTFHLSVLPPSFDLAIELTENQCRSVVWRDWTKGWFCSSGGLLWSGLWFMVPDRWGSFSGKAGMQLRDPTLRSVPLMDQSYHIDSHGTTCSCGRLTSQSWSQSTRKLATH